MTPELDFKTPANVADPFPLYRWLREHDPVHWSEGLNGWVVSRYADAVEIFNRPADFSSDRFRKLDARYASQREEVRAVADVLGDWLVFRDPPDHTRLRALLQKSFTPRHLEKSRGRIQSMVDELLDAATEREEFDFIRDFAFPLPASVIAVLLGADASDLDSIKGWSDKLAAYVGGSVLPQDNFQAAREGLDCMVDYFGALLREKQRRPDDGLMSLMLRAEHEGDSLSPEEVVSNSVLLLFAGHETTTNLLGNGVHHLLRNEEALHAVQTGGARVEDAVEELLRYDGPVTATTKIATRDLEWRGAKIERGQMVFPVMSSANRDESVFQRPDELIPDRRPNRHLAFAYGIHFCLGAPLARLEAQLAVETLLRRFPRIAPLEAPPRWKPQLILRGLETLPLRLEG